MNALNISYIKLIVAVVDYSAYDVKFILVAKSKQKLNFLTTLCTGFHSNCYLIIFHV